MIPLTIMRIIKGKDKIRELENQYGSLKNLKRKFEKDNENMLLYSDLEDWEYFLKHPNEEQEEGKTIFIEDINIGNKDFEIIKTIKENNPNSISELAKILNKEVSFVQKKVNLLEKEGLIDFKYGSKNRKIPIVNYDKIEIAI
ncbi:MAG: winged helix-turn-helix transcriptional regulator [Methanobrevibacter sp.]|nr:winged helix-turn-helix transcriptional regulator [Methanobrevibacter sp.]